MDFATAMPQNLLNYDWMIEEALRDVVRRSLKFAETGLPGSHHFFVTFRTDAAGVTIGERLKQQYPDEMTIVIQHQYWDFAVLADYFQVTLSFNDQPEQLSVPFAAITGFADPSVKFGLQFRLPTEAAATAGETPNVTTLPVKPAAKSERLKAVPAAPKSIAKSRDTKPTLPTVTAEDENPRDNSSDKIVTLDQFRRK